MYPKLGDQVAGTLFVHLALILENRLEGHLDVMGHGDVSTHIEVTALVDELIVNHGSIVQQDVLDVYLQNMCGGGGGGGGGGDTDTDS